MPTFKPTFEDTDYRVQKVVAPEGIYELLVNSVKLHKSVKTGSTYLTAAVSFAGEAGRNYKSFIIRPIMLEGAAAGQGARFLQAVLGGGDVGKAAAANAVLETEDDLNEFNQKEGVAVTAITSGDTSISTKGLTINAAVKQGPQTNADGTTRTDDSGKEYIVNSVSSIW